MRIHLIRHGTTAANEQKLYCGATDLTLSEAGKTELLNLQAQGIYPKGSRASLYITSGLIRTEQSLEILYGAVRREVLPQLMEFCFGEFEMQSYEELRSRGDYQAWIMDESGLVSCPGGENKRDFARRVLHGFESVIDKARTISASDAFVICHGGVIACIMEHLCPGVKNFYEWQPKPGRGYTLEYDIDKFREYKEI